MIIGHKCSNCDDDDTITESYCDKCIAMYWSEKRNERLCRIVNLVK